jgi:hypothetical protein
MPFILFSFHLFFVTFTVMSTTLLARRPLKLWNPPCLVMLQPYGNCGVLVFSQDSWRDMPWWSTITLQRLKVSVIILNKICLYHPEFIVAVKQNITFITDITFNSRCLLFIISKSLVCFMFFFYFHYLKFILVFVIIWAVTWNWHIDSMFFLLPLFKVSISFCYDMSSYLELTH